MSSLVNLRERTEVYGWDSAGSFVLCDALATERILASILMVGSRKAVSGLCTWSARFQGRLPLHLIVWDLSVFFFN